MFKAVRLHREFTSQYKTHRDKVFSFIYYRTGGDRALAEDITSETFLKAYENYEDFDDRFAFSTWIYRIARNTLIDHFRRNAKTASIQLDEAIEIPDESSIEAETALRDASNEIEDLILRLPSLQRDCVTLRYLAEMDFAEIAYLLESNETNVRQAVSRGIKKLREKTSHISELATVLSSICLLFLS